jgi:hypothetical protein
MHPQSLAQSGIYLQIWANGESLFIGNQPLYVPDVELRFFEASLDHFSERDKKRRYEERRNYTSPFPQQTTRCIWGQIDGKSVQWLPSRRMYTLSYTIYRPDGTLLYNKTEDKLTIRLEDCDISFFTWRTFGYGWREPGYWPTGTYQAEVVIDGVSAATGHFTIAPPPPPPPPKPPAEVLQQPSVQFYASETGRFQTEPRRNSVRFPHQTTRWVICELRVHNSLYSQQNRWYHITAQCYTAEGKKLWEDRRDWLITSQEQEASISWGLQSGQWTVGIYRLDILIDGQDFAGGAFAIE